MNPGDLVFADYDGVVVIPQDLAGETLRLAEEKAGLENHARAELMEGSYLRDIYKKYGVL